MDTLILVDSKDREIGFAEKEECHYKKPKLHRAFSVFLFNDKGEMLITQRSDKKKTWPLFWSNACCSHPRKNESLAEATQRRMKEELGITTQLRFLFKFEYDAMFDKEWGEHEIDHVFVGKYNNEIEPNKNEISGWRFVSIDALRADIKSSPEKYTPWFKIALEKVLKNM